MAELIRGVDLEGTVYDVLYKQFSRGLFRKKLKESTLEKVKELSLMNCELKDLSFLMFFPNLELLNVSHNQVTSLKGLGYTKGLKKLLVKDNPITDYKGLLFVSGLQVLDVSMNEIHFEDMKHLIRLRELYADRCNLKEFPMEKWTQLNVLSLRHNQIKKIDEIYRYRHLQEVYLDDNEIVDASAVGVLTKMSVLHLEHNRLQKIPDLKNCQALLYLNVYDNPLLEDLDNYREKMFYIDTLILGQEDVDYFELDDQVRNEEEKTVYVVSSCLCGENCKYSGGNNYNETIMQFLKDQEYVMVCPEVLGGLSTPRPPAEICGGKICTQDGIDVSGEYLLGAKKALAIAKAHNASIAIMQTRSPSCGKGKIYDGTFTKTLKNGSGLTVRLFEKNGIYVWNSEMFVEYITKQSKKGKKVN